MKRASAIFFLLIFCVFALTTKTHYCYHLDSGERFHGDCQEDVKGFSKNGLINEFNLSQAKYFCLDFHKEHFFKNTDTASFPQTSWVLDLHLDFHFILKAPAPNVSMRCWNIKEIPIRAGPLVCSNTLRGPPLM